MNIKGKTENFCKKAKWYDISIIKGIVLFFTLFLVTSWQWFHDIVFSIDWYWYLIISIVLMIPIMRKMCFK
jgi:H+/Cl- antiporter ClcA